ncbi:MAG: hypothetical protein OHK0011_01200 [Turneriella sp.]
MAASIEKLLLEIKTDIKDLKNLRAELKQVRDEAAKAGKGISDGLSSALGGLASGFSALKIKSIMDNAVGEFNKLEKTMLGLQATARLTGSSFEELKGQVTKLASDGVLSIDQASTAMKTLLAQGIKADKAFSLLDAAKKVGAFNNIVGDTGQAVADFVKFLQTGSAELAENLDPSIIKVVKSLGGYQKVASDASAKQKLINAVIEKGGQLTQDYEKFLNSGAQAQVSFNSASQTLSQTLGQKLQPAYNALYAAGTKLVSGITGIIERSSSLSISLAAIAALLPPLGFALAAFGTKIGLAFSAALGPIGLVLGAIAAVAAVMNLNNKTFEERQQDANKAYRASKTETDALVAKLQSLSKINKRTAAEEEELARTKEALRKKAQALGIDYDALAKKTANYAEQLRILNKAEAKKAADEANEPIEKQIRSEERDYEATNEVIAQKARLREQIKADAARTGVRRDAMIAQYDREIENLQKRSSEQLKRINELRKKRVVVEDEPETKKTPDAPLSTGVGKPEQEFRYIELRDQIRELNKEYDSYLARLAAEKKFFAKDKEGKITNYKAAIERAKETIEGQEATLKLKLQTEDALSQARQKVAEFLEKEYDARLEKIEQEKRAAIEAAYEVYNQRMELAKKEPSAEKKAEAEKKAQEGLQKDLSESAAMAFSKRIKAGMDSFNQTLGAANEIGKGLTSATKGKSDVERAAGLGTVLEGAGKVVPGKVGIILQGAGQLVKTGAELYSTFKGLFGKTDEEIKQAAEEQARRDEEARKLLELQANYQKRMLEIQEANAKLPFENMQRRLRLVDISIQQRRLAGESEDILTNDRLTQRRELIQTTLREQSGKIGEGRLFGGTSATPEDLTTFLSQRAAQEPYVQSFVEYANAALGNVGSIQELEQYYGYMQSLAANVPAELAASGLQAVQRKIANFWDKYRFIQSDSVTARTSRENRERFMRDALLAANYAAPDAGIAIDADSEGFYDVRRIGDSGLSLINELASEFRSDTSVAENLLSVIEQDYQIQLEIKDAAKKTAENTAKLTQIDDRRRSFLDLGNRRIFSQGLNIDFQNVKLPEAAAATILATSPLPGLQSDTVTELKKLVSIAEEQSEWLAIIAANTDQRAGTDTSSIDNYLIRKLAEIRARRIS